jgi:hypothetical protein
MGDRPDRSEMTMASLSSCSIQRIVGDTPEHTAIVKFILEVSFLPQGALVWEAGFFEHTVRRAVAGQRPSLDAIEPERLMTIGDDCPERFGHQTTTPEFGVRFVSGILRFLSIYTHASAKDRFVTGRRGGRPAPGSDHRLLVRQEVTARARRRKGWFRSHPPVNNGPSAR